MATVGSAQTPRVPPQRLSGALRLSGLSVLCLTGAGALLWWRHGGEVFNSLVIGALAWCF